MKTAWGNVAKWRQIANQAESSIFSSVIDAIIILFRTEQGKRLIHSY
ncbi:hypothetical protein [Photobacterium halotolerans]|nr:hypothetical protein [Photobacterium halotolerans]NAW87104.1 hypothetical protein [Photobacterium halotolerans]